MALAAAALLAIISAIVVFAGSAMIDGANARHDISIMHTVAVTAIATAQNAGSATISISPNQITISTTPPYPHIRVFQLPAPLSSQQTFPITATVSSTGILTGLSAPTITLDIAHTTATESLNDNQQFAFTP